MGFGCFECVRCAASPGIGHRASPPSRLAPSTIKTLPDGVTLLTYRGTQSGGAQVRASVAGRRERWRVLTLCRVVSGSGVAAREDGVVIDPDLRQQRHSLERGAIESWAEIAHSVWLGADVLQGLVPAKEGSFLLPAKSEAAQNGGPFENMTWWCHGFLEAAADHLVHWADHAFPSRGRSDVEVHHTLRPAFTLARAALEASAQAIWILSPPSLSQCASRYMVIATWDVAEQYKAATDADVREELQDRRDSIFRALGVTPRTFRPPRYIEMVREAIAFVDAGDRSRVERAERVWRSAAAAAHGKHWPEFELHDRTHVTGRLFSSVPKIELMTEVLGMASEFLLAGVTLFAMRVGRENELHQLWDEAAERIKLSMRSP